MLDSEVPLDAQTPVVQAVELSPATRKAASLLAFALVFAALDVALALAVHALLGDAGGWVYRTGVAVHLIGSFLLGALLGAPFALMPPSRGTGLAVSATLTGVLLAVHTLAYQLHADGGHLPTLNSLTLVPGLPEAGALLGRSAALGLVGGGIATYAAPRLVARLSGRLASAGARLADGVTTALFGLVWLGTVIGATGPLYYGATLPSLFLLGGNVQTQIDAPAITASTHSHGHHDHDEEGEHVHTSHQHAAELLQPDPPPPDGIPRPPVDVRLLLQKILQSDPPRTVPDVSFPFCRGDELDAHRIAARSVLMIDVSGIDLETLRDETDALPTLSALSAREASFERVYAPGPDALAGLTSVLSGLPALVRTPGEVMPVPRLPSIAAELGSAGFITAAFASEHLGADARGVLLRRAGFGHVDGPALGRDAAARVGAGRADQATVSALRRWVEATRAEQPRMPLFALATLQSGRAGVEGRADVDAAVKSLLNWYYQSEAPKGTLLVLFSDTPGNRPASAVRQDAPAVQRARLEVPLVFVGLDEAEKTRATEVRARLGGLQDLPQTLLALLGSDYRGCHQGLDLLQADADWPERRVVPIYPQADQRVLVAQDGSFRWFLERGSERASLFETKDDPALRADLWADNDAGWIEMQQFRDAYEAVGRYLTRHDRYAPPLERSSRPVVTRRAPVAQAATDFGGASLSATARLREAKRAGLTRASILVTVDAAGAPVAGDEPLASVLAQRGSLELELVIGALPSGAAQLDALRAIVAVAEAGRGAIRWRAPTPAIAAALGSGASRPVGLALSSAQLSTGWLDLASELGCVFVSVPGGAINGLFVERAHHRGLVVEADGLESAEARAAFGELAPDAITWSVTPTID